MDFCVVYLHVRPVLQRVAHESLEQDIDFHSVELADVIQEVFSKFVVDLAAEKPIDNNHLSWVGPDLCFAFAVGILSQGLQGRKHRGIECLVDSPLKIVPCLFLPARLNGVPEEANNIIADVFIEFGLFFELIDLSRRMST